MKITFTLSLLFSLLVLQVFSEEIPNDSTKNYSFSEIIVSANRYETFLLQSTSSVNKISALQLRNYPLQSLVSTLQFTPGFFSANLDGLGKIPVVTSRGFYGGGEAEYINFLVDGVETNYAQSGLANWQIIPKEALSNIEILRGGASSLYGDASIGGVINVNTLDGLNRTVLSFEGGEFGQLNTSIFRNSAFGENEYSLYASYDNSKGFREHSNWRLTSFGGNILLPLSEKFSLSLITHNQINRSELPGPLTETEVTKSRTSSSSYYKYDEKSENRFIISPKLSYLISQSDKINLQMGLKLRNEDKTQTFTNFAPIINPQDFSIIGIYDTTQYADTKSRELENNEFFGELIYKSKLEKLPLEFILGTKLNYSDYTSSYFDYFKGFLEDYNNSDVKKGQNVFSAEGNRTEFSGFLSSTIDITDNIRIDLGLRYDKISDEYNSTKPDSLINSDNDAFSPKVGLNYFYANSKDYKASIYANYNKSFKAPTIDQLTDLKKLDFLIFIPTGPDSYMTSPFQAEPFANSNLEPQKSNNYEFGTYQSFGLTENTNLELQLSLYQIDIDDEIDFDLSTFKYQNIAKTKHRGIEFGAVVDLGRNLNAIFNYTFSEVTFESGQLEGKQLKGIPKHIANIGVNYSFDFGLSLGMAVNSVNDIYLDDDNTTLLENYLVANTKLSFDWNNIDLSLNVYNLFNTEYSSTGYISDGIKYLFPAAQRYLTAGVKYEF